MVDGNRDDVVGATSATAGRLALVMASAPNKKFRLILVCLGMAFLVLQQRQEGTKGKR